jgi:hypothetical protein
LCSLFFGTGGAWVHNANCDLSFFGKEIEKITKRVTGNVTRLGSKPGDKAVEVLFKDGTIFDMELTRVKETVFNPHIQKPVPKLFENALDTTRKKRAPTEAEIQWFNDLFK